MGMSSQRLDNELTEITYVMKFIHGQQSWWLQLLNILVDDKERHAFHWHIYVDTGDISELVLAIKTRCFAKSFCNVL